MHVMALFLTTLLSLAPGLAMDPNNRGVDVKVVGASSTSDVDLLSQGEVTPDDSVSSSLPGDEDTSGAPQTPPDWP